VIDSKRYRLAIRTKVDSLCAYSLSGSGDRNPKGALN
jgi:hypothetical protein